VSDKLNGVFVTASGFLNGRPGGAQHCTTEYIETLTAAGVDLHILSFELDRRVASRLLKKIWPSSYVRHNEPGLIERIRATVERTNAPFVFLNQVQLAPLAENLRKLLRPGCKIVVLSHGLESTDLLHTLRFSNDPPIALPKYVFGRQLLTDSLRRESAYRPHLDLILCLSAFDVELEHWLGAANAVWVPRTVRDRPLNWNPTGNRLGFVGTLDHAPNLEGLLLFLRSASELASSDFRVRIVGGPDRIGGPLMERFSFVDYLGPLSDEDLRQEASSWNCFVHPIFCYPRGCSTKLATAIGWQLPILTTTAGRRGYAWSDGELLIADSPEAFSRCAVEVMDRAAAQRARENVIQVARSMPSTEVVGQQLAKILAGTVNVGGHNCAS
jgi:Glycosyl transferases group 1